MSHFPSFEVIPAVDVQDGEVVQLVGGERGTGKRYGDPVEAAERWIEAGAETLHLVDLDGAFEGERVNADAIEGRRRERPGRDRPPARRRHPDRRGRARAPRSGAGPRHPRDRGGRDARSSPRSTRRTPAASSSASTRKTARSS